ncbi:TrmH family RNA methyltransferase [Pseudohoeflea coraliihabitans]|uniref:RNA methyltransferase n=1 Tax=Pseudohoeflea coraliihabitans TaxID=2860393 RepID=A0ABS6WV81_9HYPH|nr:RNA methyltransferase [Pseudohoeflea sp. DP4N28-3]MBW3098984.1 RNA methyltransferase [Pseudohoeflea sp. DP4N28-3]
MPSSFDPDKRAGSGRKAGDDPKADRDSDYAQKRRAFRDAKRQKEGLPPLTPGRGGRDSTRPARKGSLYGAKAPADSVHLYGLHTVRAALSNERRRIERMWVSQNALRRLEIDDPAALPFACDVVHPGELDKMLGDDAVHQGVLIEARPLEPRPLSALGDTPLIVILDQVTDPHNVGAVLRSAVAFDAGAVITTQRHSPQESGVLAKSASGALELIDIIVTRNLAEAITTVAAQGYQTIGLDSEGDAPLEASFSGGKIALIVGAEGKGLRQKTRATVSDLARLDMPGAIKSLNVSNATAIALYAARAHLRTQSAG